MVKSCEEKGHMIRDIGNIGMEVMKMRLPGQRK